MARVLLDNAVKRHGSDPALDRLPLDVAEREVITLLGPSGWGKATTRG